MSENYKDAKSKQIIDEYYPDIYKFCCARCRNADDAQDITQETFALLIEKFDELHFENIDSWLFSVANNKVKEYFKQLKKDKNFISVDDVDIPSADNTSVVEDTVWDESMFDDTQ